MLIIFGVLIIIIVLVRFRNTQDKDSKKVHEETLKREQASHFVPRKDISKLDYLKVDLSALPFHHASLIPEKSTDSPEPSEFNVSASPDGTHHAGDMAPMEEEIRSVEQELLALSDKKILNLTGISNTDLRFMYGSANLEPLSACDQNFTILIRLLQKWGNLLVSSGAYEDAIRVLSYAVSVGSDITGTYALLARLYKGLNQYDKINELKVQADKLTTLMKPAILKDLDSLTAITDELKDILL